ncbi:hypothetical protein PFISCL1PPCAC_4768, partial [Pristionchus fissidentatus]
AAKAADRAAAAAKSKENALAAMKARKKERAALESARNKPSAVLTSFYAEIERAQAKQAAAAAASDEEYDAARAARLRWWTHPEEECSSSTPEPVPPRAPYGEEAHRAALDAFFDASVDDNDDRLKPEPGTVHYDEETACYEAVVARAYKPAIPPHYRRVRHTPSLLQLLQEFAQLEVLRLRLPGLLNLIGLSGLLKSLRGKTYEEMEETLRRHIDRVYESGGTLDDDQFEICSKNAILFSLFL